MIYCIGLMTKNVPKMIFVVFVFGVSLSFLYSGSIQTGLVMSYPATLITRSMDEQRKAHRKTIQLQHHVKHHYIGVCNTKW